MPDNGITLEYIAPREVPVMPEPGERRYGRTKVLLAAGVIVVAAGSGTAVGLVAGSYPGSVSRPYFQPASQVTLTCGTIPGTSTTGQTLGDDIGLLAADNTAIGGNWAAAEAEATAAQDQAINDLTQTLTDFSIAVQVRGQLASDISTFYYAASHLTNGTPGSQLQGPVVESDLLTLAAECQLRWPGAAPRAAHQSRWSHLRGGSGRRGALWQ